MLATHDRKFIYAKSILMNVIIIRLYNKFSLAKVLELEAKFWSAITAKLCCKGKKGPDGEFFL